MCRSLKQRIFCEILKLTAEGTTTFITGMARGVDTWAAETVLQLKGIIPNREIKLWAAIPYARQAEAWAEEDQKRYYQILGQADRIEYISTAYYYDALRERNRWLVDHADCLLAVYDGQPGGTKYTIDYARKMGLRIILRQHRSFPPIRERMNRIVWPNLSHVISQKTAVFLFCVGDSFRADYDHHQQHELDEYRATARDRTY